MFILNICRYVPSIFFAPTFVGQGTGPSLLVKPGVIVFSSLSESMKASIDSAWNLTMYLMKEIFSNNFELLVINLEVVETAASFLAAYRSNCNGLSYCNCSKLFY